MIEKIRIFRQSIPAVFIQTERKKKIPCLERKKEKKKQTNTKTQNKKGKGKENKTTEASFKIVQLAAMQKE